MKLIKHSSLLFAICSTFLLIGCNKQKSEPSPTIKINPVELEIFEDDSSTLSVETNSSKPISFISYDTDIACVNSSGRVIGKNVGSTTIKATVDDVFATCSVTVRPLSEKKGDYIKFESNSFVIGLNDNSLNQIKPTYYSDGKVVSDKTFSYTSLDSNIATVASDGKINALTSGTTTISVTSGELTSYVFVDVYDIVIRTTDDWDEMLKPTDDINARFYLANDLDFENVSYAIHAESLDNRLTGQLNGNFHTVKNIKFPVSNDRQSLFGYATVFDLSNIRFENIEFNSNVKNCGLFVSLLQHTDEKDSSGNTINAVYSSSVSNVLCDFSFSNVTSCIIAENFYGGSVDNVFAHIENNEGKAFKSVNTYATSEHFYNWFGTSHIVNLVVHVESGSIQVEPKKTASDDYLLLDQVKINSTNSIVEANFLASQSFDMNIWNLKPTDLPTFF